MSTASVNVMHAVPGRIRLQVGRLKGNADYAARIRQALPDVPGVESVEINQDTGNVVIAFDEDQSTSMVFHVSVANALDVSPTDFDPDELAALVNGVQSASTNGSQPQTDTSDVPLPVPVPSLLATIHVAQPLAVCDCAFRRCNHVRVWLNPSPIFCVTKMVLPRFPSTALAIA